MGLQNFLDKYDLKPIVVANENIKIGTIAEKNIFGKVTDIGPETLIHVLSKHEVITNEEKSVLQRAIDNLALSDANIMNLKTQVNVNFKSELNIPGLGDFGAIFNDDAKISYQFTNIKAKLMTGELYAELGKLLDEFKASNWDKYKKDLRKSHYVEELYYGNVDISIERSLSSELEAALQEQNVNFEVKGGLGKMQLIQISNSLLPFAMKLERIKGM